MRSLGDSCHNINTLRPRQNGRHFSDDIFKCIFLNENVWISISILLQFYCKSKGSIRNIPALVQLMAWSRLGDKPLSEPMLVCSPTHICFSRPQWVNTMPSHPYCISLKWDNYSVCFRLSTMLGIYCLVPPRYVRWWIQTWCRLHAIPVRGDSSLCCPFNPRLIWSVPLSWDATYCSTMALQSARDGCITSHDDVITWKLFPRY